TASCAPRAGTTRCACTTRLRACTPAASRAPAPGARERKTPEPERRQRSALLLHGGALDLEEPRRGQLEALAQRVPVVPCAGARHGPHAFGQRHPAGCRPPARGGGEPLGIAEAGLAYVLARARVAVV